MLLPTEPVRAVGPAGYRPGMAEQWTVEDHLAQGSDAGRRLYHRFIDVVGSIGPFSYAVAKTTITLKGDRRGFAGARPKGDRLIGYFDAQREIADPRILSVAPYTKRLFVHHFRIDSLAQLDDTFAGWLIEAYAVGAGEHLLR